MKQWIIRKALPMLLSVAMVMSMNGVPIYAAGSAAESCEGLCKHHTKHTADCGYEEAKPGAPCTHEHTEDCYQTVKNCIHEHTDDCYAKDSTLEDTGISADAQPVMCSHICSEESGCITKKLDCHHEHDEGCGYQEEMPGSPCHNNWDDYQRGAGSSGYAYGERGEYYTKQHYTGYC